MTLEKGLQENIELTDKERTFLEAVFSESKIYDDAFNEILWALNILAFVRRGDEEAIKRHVQKIKSGYRTRHYLQRIQETTSPAEFEYIKSHSDPEAVRKFDEIVDIINNETVSILEARDEKRADELANLFRTLRKNKK